jgi:internalin A
VLQLLDTKIGDMGLSHLKGLTQLQNLNLDGTAVTDAGLEYLKGLARLQKLSLINTGVTDAGQKDLQRSLPRTTIYRPLGS